MNPELHRNLLLELTPHRLVAMPAILLLLFTAVGAAGDRGDVSDVSVYIMFGLLLLWGSRLAADAVLGEVAGRTWDAQRMSSLGPWAMSWGKVLGSTVFVWYGVLCCVPAFLLGPLRPRGELLDIVLTGLFCHAMALFISLLVQRARPERMRFQVSLVQILAIGAALLYRGDFWLVLAGTGWYGLGIEPATFVLAARSVFLAWAFVGVYRLMRVELQYRSRPFVWLAFVVSFAVYAAGFAPSIDAGFVDIRFIGAVGRSLVAFLVAVAMTYAAAIVEPKGFVRVRRFGLAVGRRQLARALEVTPGWAVSGGVAVALAVATIVAWQTAPRSSDPFNVLQVVDGLPAFVIAVLLFAARDIGLIYFLTLDGRARRGHLAALIYLAALYGVLPIIVIAVSLETWTPVFLPSPFGHPAMVLLPVAAQVAVVGLLIGWRWRRLQVAGAQMSRQSGS